jgi:hypothetical protein
MKALITPLCCMMLYACIFSIAGCKKYDNLPGCPTPDCQIVKLGGNIPDFDSVVISYNGKGNPVAMVRTQASTGSPNYEFRYDKKQRVTDFIGVYENGGFEFWHRYAYDQHNRVITDSIYKFGWFGPGPLPEQYAEQYSSFTYDSHNRIVKAVDVFKVPAPTVWTSFYHYNAAGNLDSVVTIFPDGRGSTIFTSYDNKINMHQLHPVWQLIDRDYSVNNHFTALSYNAQGLPTVIPAKEAASNFASIPFYGNLEVFYKCR